MFISHLSYQLCVVFAPLQLACELELQPSFNDEVCYSARALERGSALFTSVSLVNDFTCGLLRVHVTLRKHLLLDLRP
jgi:hypothetical protein